LLGQPYAGALEAVDRILNREPEADEVLRQTVAVLHDRIDRYSWVGLFFVEGDELVLGPSKGEAQEGAVELETPVVYDGKRIAALTVKTGHAGGFDADDEVFLGRVALLVSAHSLVGWDTGGVPWADAG
jgi:putative methionine-R-sulfoxide reductase with GAF domain